MRVMLRIPTHGTIDPALARWLIWAAREDPTLDIDLFTNSFGPAEARNHLVDKFFMSDCDKLWMIDSDIVPPQNLSILDHDKPIVAGPCPCYLGDGTWYWNTYQIVRSNNKIRRLPEKRWKKRLFKADAVGAGCLVLSREMVEQCTQPVFGNLCISVAPYRIIGEDIAFCMQHRGDVWVDPDYRCKHFRDVQLSDLKRREE